ncbi:hypothetical protein [Bradyrhizobium mercantei]|uniref:hypothetical protein n=1 Tax=Bradyrhizobium mercantei TaxID=1904807 RepID=UPI000976EB9C|nr:hypothetical protein [Bradyrhizobium mercantei]
MTSVNRCPTAVVPIEEVERFEQELVSLFVLAKQRGRHFRAVKKELDTAGVKPAPDPDQIGATYHRRREIAAKGTANRQPAGKGIQVTYTYAQFKAAHRAGS